MKNLNAIFSFQQAKIIRKLWSRINFLSKQIETHDCLELSIKTGNTITPEDFTILLTSNVTLPDPSLTPGKIYNFVYDGTDVVVSGNIRLYGVNASSYGLNFNNPVKSLTVQSNGSQWVVISSFNT